jgi:cell division septal protein FtsQ
LARKKRKSKKTKGYGFNFSGRKKAKGKSSSAGLRVVGIAFVLIAVAAAVVVGLFYLEKYVKSQRPIAAGYGKIELVGKPKWFNSGLDRLVEKAVGAKEIRLDETTAEQVGRALGSVVWLRNVKVQTGIDRVIVTAEYRKPLAVFNSGRRKYYIDNDGVVLNFVPISELAIVEIKGLKGSNMPGVGAVWGDGDVEGAMELITLLGTMDGISVPESPLLNEIAAIDVTNFDGRRRKSTPHIIIETADGTPIYWGAAPGKAAANLEALEREKLAMLYGFYNRYGTVQLKGRIKYIELRNPQKEIPRPGE